MKLRGRLKKHTEANHMIWYLSGHFAQWCNLKQKSIYFLCFALFHSSLMHCPLFRRCPKIRPCVWYCTTDSGSHSGSWKNFKLLSVNGSRTDSGPVLYCLSVVTYVWSHHMTGLKKYSGSIVPRQHRELSAFSHGFSFSHVSCLSTFRHGTHTQFLCWSLAKKQIHVLQGWSDDMLIFSPTPHHCSFFPPSPKVRGHRAGSLLSSWHLEVRAARRSGAWGSASSTCRNTTSSSCWRTALSSCAPPGQTGPWPSSGSTSRGWRRFVWTQLKLQW